jgi:hypothetical protein
LTTRPDGRVLLRVDLETMEHEAPPRHSSPRGALDRVYDRLLRDLFARAVPGLLLLLSLAISITSFAEVARTVERATGWMWVLAFGAGWLTAFGILEIGRRVNLVLLSLDTITGEQYWAAEERFRATASRRQHAEYERLITVRDATAVASVSLFLSLAALGADFVVDVHLHESPWSEIQNGATALVVLVGVGIALQLMHRDCVKRAWRYLAYGRNGRLEERGRSTPPVP